MEAITKRQLEARRAYHDIGGIFQVPNMLEYDCKMEVLGIEKTVQLRYFINECQWKIVYEKRAGSVLLFSFMAMIYGMSAHYCFLVFHILLVIMTIIPMIKAMMIMAASKIWDISTT